MMVMKENKTKKYNEPQMEIVRLEAEEILNGVIISGTKMDDDVPEVGGVGFQIN